MLKKIYNLLSKRPWVSRAINWICVFTILMCIKESIVELAIVVLALIVMHFLIVREFYAYIDDDESVDN